MPRSISATPEKAATDNSQPSVWSVYIIENRFGQLYTGITTDVNRRVTEHAHHPTKGAKALRGKGPLRLKFEQCVGDHSQALRCERWIKALRREKKLAVIAGTQPLPDLPL
ncbi:GIY-YIG nuclease family protein [Alteromonas oceanisediminis]|uniref:GIY-YIG nuclease family protein n=1 Tax=Alteromonas oceanisediminis TaxID=2836180 RepID=UPI001BDA11D6|nr:GIY-YIG nuclease family protein [Alteromonas oceanisediminis]MBT0585654.1 GIY-YIG nuclease family protein [Alteromonas oceanisediminis]